MGMAHTLTLTHSARTEIQPLEHMRRCMHAWTHGTHGMHGTRRTVLTVRTVDIVWTIRDAWLSTLGLDIGWSTNLKLPGCNTCGHPTGSYCDDCRSFCTQCEEEPCKRWVRPLDLVPCKACWKYGQPVYRTAAQGPPRDGIIMPVRVCDACFFTL